MQNPSVKAFEQFLFEHDLARSPVPRTHTNMLGGKTMIEEYANSGNYGIPKSEFPALRNLILALPVNYRHGLSRNMPDRFNYFVDVDTGVFKQRPTVESLGEWAIDISRTLQEIIAESVQGNPRMGVVISIISARKVKGGFKPGIHLHVPDLVVERQTAIFLSSTLASRLVMPNNLRLPCTDINKLIDTEIYRSQGGALRMHNATKMGDELTRYKLYATVSADGESTIDPKFTPLEIYNMTELDTKEDSPLTQLSCNLAKSPHQLDASNVEPESKRQRQAGEKQAIVKMEEDNLFEELVREKVERYFPQARIRAITKQNGTVWLVKLASKYCWMKQADHDSESAFLSVTKNGIQPRCNSSVCHLRQKMPRVPCFNGAEMLRFFPAPDASLPSSSLDLQVQEDPITKAVVDEYNQRFAYVMVGENNCSLLVLERSVDPLTGTKNVRFMSTKVFSEWNRDERAPDGRFKADIWLNSPRQARYKNLVFMPGVDTEADGWFNMWQGPAWPIHEEWIKAGEQPLEFYMSDPDLQLGLSFIKECVASGLDETFNYLLSWIAFAVQRPDTPSEVILALRGERGVGKSCFGEICSRLFGSYGKVIEAKQLSADFNGSLKNTIMLVGDEAAGDFDPEAMVRLQNISTATYLDINQKNIERFRVKNCLHIIIVSNFKNVVAAGRDARRYCIIEVSSAHKLDYPYFSKVKASLTPMFFSKLLTMLMQRNLEGWVKTDWPLESQLPLWENKQIALTPTEHWLYAKLRAADEQSWRTIVPRDTVYKESAEYEVSGRRKIPRAVAVEQELNSIFKISGHKVCSTATGVGSPMATIAGKKVAAFRFPSLEECRKIYANYVETNPLILWT